MIILSEVATKLEAILNDSNNPSGLFYQVETEGFHIDHIAKETKDGNFIPVFVSSMGGQFNPVKGLKQGSYSLPIVFYFPVRFKEKIYALGEYLVDTFVGEVINYGAISGKAVSNVSVPVFGEIQNLDFKQFEAWVVDTYQRPLEKMEPYMTMQINLYLSNSASGLIYGNDIKTNLSFTYNNNTYSLDDVDVDGSSLQSNSQAQSEQEEGTPESDSLPFGTTYGSSIKVYPNLEVLAKESPSVPNALNPAIYFYEKLLEIWLEGNIMDVECTFTLVIANKQNLTFSRKCYIQSIVAPIEKGQLFSLTITFVKKTEFDDVEPEEV